MSEKVEDLSIEWTNDEGVLVTKQLDMAILSKGAWATVMFLYQDLDRKTGEYNDPKVRLERYRKSGGTYRSQSRFKISSEKQARAIIEHLQGWFPPEETEEKA